MKTNPAPLGAAELSAMLGVEVPPLPEGVRIEGITTLDEAGPRHASFVARAKFAREAGASKAAIVLVPPGTVLERPGVVPVRDIWGGVLTLLEHFHPEPPARASVHPTAVVPESCAIAANVEVGPYAVLGERVSIGAGTRIGAHCVIGDDASVGEGCLLHPRVTIMHGCRIGRRVILHPGAVIGSDGFKYEPARGKFHKIPQVGIVVLGDDVEIGANTTIDRASFTQTSIGARTKIDNLVQIAHNVSTGSDCIIVSQTGIAGSTKLGRGVVLAGQVGVRDNISIGDGVQVGARSGIDADVPPGSKMMGYPLLPVTQHHRLLAILKRLPDVYRKLAPYLGESSPEGS